MANGKRRMYTVSFRDPAVDQKLDALKEAYGLPRGKLLELIVREVRFAGIQIAQQHAEVASAAASE